MRKVVNDPDFSHHLSILIGENSSKRFAYRSLLESIYHPMSFHQQGQTTSRPSPFIGL